MTHLFALLAQAGMPDPAGNLWDFVKDQSKSLWYIGVIAASVVFFFNRKREGFGHTVMMAVGFGILIFSAPGLGRAITRLGNALFT
jgi:hypothetical protein